MLSNHVRLLSLPNPTIVRGGHHFQVYNRPTLVYPGTVLILSYHLLYILFKLNIIIRQACINLSISCSSLMSHPFVILLRSKSDKGPGAWSDLGCRGSLRDIASKTLHPNYRL